MTSIDDLFKKPNVPSGGSIKRKFEAPDAEQAYKAAKLSSNGSPRAANGHAATAEDADDNDDEDIEAGPSLPPEDDDDDEEGRFFGGGVSRDAAQALDYIDEQDENAEQYKEEKIDSAWLKRLAVSFERKVAKNAELRARYEDDPQKFMASEADLDDEVRSWSLLSEHPELYPEFAQMQAAGSLVGLLAHENTDIAIRAIEILAELLDEDVAAEQEAWDAVVAGFLEANLLELLMSNLGRLDEEGESDRSGVYHSLAVFESLASQPSVAEKVGQVKVLKWLCERIRKPESQLGQNKQYTAEVLQVLLQSSPSLRRRLAVDIDGVDLLLQLLAAYRKRDPPKNSHEEEYAENLFDALTCVVDEPEGKSKFVEAEGVELCLIMLSEGSFSKLRSLRLLDHAVGGQGIAAVKVCQTLVEAAGLKTLFGIFKKKSDNATIEHVLGIFAALLRLLPGESAERIRLLAKFEEKEYEKIEKLAVLRKQYASRVAAVDEEISLEKRMLDEEEREERSDEWLSRRLDAGLFCLQTIDTILAWLFAEDPAAKKRVLDFMPSLEPVKASLTEQLEDLDPEAQQDEDMREMLGTLLSFL